MRRGDGAVGAEVGRLAKGSHGRSKHGRGCECPRCRGFQSGHRHTMDHGAYAEVALAEEARPIAERLRMLLPAPNPADAPLVEQLAFTLRRVQRAAARLEAADENADGETFERLSRDTRGWVALGVRIAEKLAMSPGARASLGLAHAQTARTEAEALLAAVDLERVRLERLSDVQLHGLVDALEAATTHDGEHR